MQTQPLGALVFELRGTGKGKERVKGVKHRRYIVRGGLREQKTSPKLILSLQQADFLLWTVSPSACLGLYVSSLILCFPPFTSLVSIIVSNVMSVLMHCCERYSFSDGAVVKWDI